MKRKVLTVAAGLALLALVLVPVSARYPKADSDRNLPRIDLPLRPIVLPAASIAAQAEKAADLKVMSAAIKASGLEEALKTRGPLTLFAPSDAAFAKLPKEQVDALFRDPDRLRAFVLQHVVSGAVTSRTLALLDEVRDVRGAEHAVAVTGRALRVDGARLVRADVKAANGTLHVIDQVLIPAV
jgi:uncharacterized surface protein with fasciclin (FAS1) repeats